MTNVLEWLEHMEAQSGEKIAVADPKEEYSFTQLKMYAQKGGTYLRKWMTGTAPVAIYMEKSCVTLSIMFGAVYAGCPYCLLDLRQPEARLQADHNRAAAGSNRYKGRKSGENEKVSGCNSRGCSENDNFAGREVFG